MSIDFYVSGTVQLGVEMLWFPILLQALFAIYHSLHSCDFLGFGRPSPLSCSKALRCVTLIGIGIVAVFITDKIPFTVRTPQSTQLQDSKTPAPIDP